ncbi:MAG: hypothetical protein KIC80_02050 [Brachyspira sp.]|nr:hypothetical protein [Brachyspira sp.]CCY23468.1 unknown [Brachyspira sp. CAG:484]
MFWAKFNIAATILEELQEYLEELTEKTTVSNEEIKKAFSKCIDLNTALIHVLAEADKLQKSSLS